MLGLFPEGDQHSGDDTEVVREMEVGTCQRRADHASLAKNASVAAAQIEEEVRTTEPEEINMFHRMQAGESKR